jgi:hypothetical protein
VSIRDLFCSVDAFWQQCEPLWERELVAAGRRRRRATRLSPSAIMSILILFQQSGYRTYKGFYTQHIPVHWRAEFPHLVSYTRFVDLMPRLLLPLAVWRHTPLGTCTHMSFVDATALVVCHNGGSDRTRSSVRMHGVARPRDRLVLRLKAAPGRQRTRRTLGLLPHAGQCG